MSFRSIAMLSLLLVLPTAAFADLGTWRVEGEIINVEANFNSFEPRECPVEGARLRFFSRWSDGIGCIVGFVGECPWGPNWGEDTTDSQGTFIEQSHVMLHVSRRRDVLIEYNDWGSWRRLAVVSDLRGTAPDYEAGDARVFDLGTIHTEVFQCPSVFVPVEEAEEVRPRIVRVPPGFYDNHYKNDDKPKKGGKHKKGNKPNKNSPFGEAEFAPLPCGMRPDGSFIGPDLAFDFTDVRHRDGQPAAPPERVTWEVTVYNNGPVTYRDSGNCRTRVEAMFYIPENNDLRRKDVEITGTIAPGQSRTYTADANLGEFSEASSSSYNVVFTIDPDGVIPELDETNNVQAGCYAPLTEAYVESPCP